jgi:hypothetical protein
METEIGEINFDTNFHGFTQLYETDKSKSVRADFITVSGLDGHPYGSWRGRGSLGKMWLRHFLSKDFSDCRTLIFGYDSKLRVDGAHTVLD